MVGVLYREEHKLWKFPVCVTSGRETVVTLLYDYNLFYELVREISVHPLGPQRDCNVGQFRVRAACADTQHNQHAHNAHVATKKLPFRKIITQMT